SRFLRLDHANGHGPAYRAIEGIYDGALGFYERTLRWVMNHRRTALAFSMGILLGTVGLFMIVPKGFIPTEDTGRITGSTETAEGTSFDAMVAHQRQVAEVIAADPNVDASMSSVGAGGQSSSVNQGRVLLRLKPRNQRKLSADDVIRELQPKL